MLRIILKEKGAFVMCSAVNNALNIPICIYDEKCKSV